MFNYMWSIFGQTRYYHDHLRHTIIGRTDKQASNIHVVFKVSSKHETLNQCWFNVVPASQTVAQPWTSFGSMSRVCSDSTPVKWHDDKAINQIYNITKLMDTDLALPTTLLSKASHCLGDHHSITRGGGVEVILKYFRTEFAWNK